MLLWTQHHEGMEDQSNAKPSNTFSIAVLGWNDLQKPILCKLSTNSENLLIHFFDECLLQVT